MGACLSCLGLQRDTNTNNHSDAERQRLLFDDSFSNAHGANYGSWSQAPPVPSQNFMSPEEMRREQNALNSITRWASDQIVEIFPHRTALANINLGASTHINGNNGGGGGGGPELAAPPTASISENGNGNGHATTMSASAHQDILLSMIPGDKSKRSIRIYPASRPGSSLSQTDSIRSKGSAGRPNGHHTASASKAKGVFVKLNVEL